MIDRIKTVLTPRVRRWAYGVTGAGLAVAGVYGLVDGEQLAAWMGLSAALFGLAIVHTPRDQGDGQ